MKLKIPQKPARKKFETLESFEHEISQKIWLHSTIIKNESKQKAFMESINKEFQYWLLLLDSSSLLADDLESAQLLVSMHAVLNESLVIDRWYSESQNF